MNINPALYWHSVYTSGMWEIADWITLGIGIAILGSLWNLHRDIADLRERMARLEGLFEGFTKREADGRD